MLDIESVQLNKDVTLEQEPTNDIFIIAKPLTQVCPYNIPTSQYNNYLPTLQVAQFAVKTLFIFALVIALAMQFVGSSSGSSWPTVTQATSDQGVLNDTVGLQGSYWSLYAERATKALRAVFQPEVGDEIVVTAEDKIREFFRLLKTCYCDVLSPWDFGGANEFLLADQDGVVPPAQAGADTFETRYSSDHSVIRNLFFPSRRIRVRIDADSVFSFYTQGSRSKGKPYQNELQMRHPQWDIEWTNWSGGTVGSIALYMPKQNEVDLTIVACMMNGCCHQNGTFRGEPLEMSAEFDALAEKMLQSQRCFLIFGGKSTTWLRPDMGQHR